jgi:hypothetical protein
MEDDNNFTALDPVALSASQIAAVSTPSVSTPSSQRINLNDKNLFEEVEGCTIDRNK